MRCASVTAVIPHLLGRAHHRTVRTENAAISRLGPQNLIAVLALVEELARVRWHRFYPYMSTGRTGQFALKNWTGHGSLAQNLTVAGAWSLFARRVADTGRQSHSPPRAPACHEPKRAGSTPRPSSSGHTATAVQLPCSPAIVDGSIFEFPADPLRVILAKTKIDRTPLSGDKGSSRRDRECSLSRKGGTRSDTVWRVQSGLLHL